MEAFSAFIFLLREWRLKQPVVFLVKIGEEVIIKKRVKKKLDWQFLDYEDFISLITEVVGEDFYDSKPGNWGEFYGLEIRVGEEVRLSEIDFVGGVLKELKNREKWTNT